jgi:hypothetical protein
VAFLSDGERVQVVAVPKDPLILGSKEEFWESVARTDKDVAEKRAHSVADAVDALRSKYGL